MIKNKLIATIVLVLLSINTFWTVSSVHAVTGNFADGISGSVVVNTSASGSTTHSAHPIPQIDVLVVGENSCGGTLHVIQSTLYQAYSTTFVSSSVLAEPDTGQCPDSNNWVNRGTTYHYADKGAGYVFYGQLMDAVLK